MSLKIKIEDLEKVDSEISVVLKVKMLDKIRSEITSRGSLRKFSIELGFSPSFIPNLLNGWIKSTRLKFFRKISEKLNLKIEDFIECIIAKNSPKSFIPVGAFPINESTDLASLVGHAFADGNVSKLHFSFTNKSEKLISDVIKKVRSLSIHNVVFSKSFHKAMNIEFSKLVRDILLVAGAPEGRKVNQKLKIPEWIKKGSSEIKKSFLQALLNDEATVQLNSKEIVLGMKKSLFIINDLENFFKEVKILFNELGVNGITITDGNIFVTKSGEITKEKRLRICGVINFIKLKNKVGFIHPNKEEKLNKLIIQIRKNLLKMHQSKIKIVEILKKEGKLSTIGLSKRIGKTRRITGDHLRELEKINVVDRIRVQDKTKPHIWFLDKPENFKILKFIHLSIPSPATQESIEQLMRKL